MEKKEKRTRLTEKMRRELIRAYVAEQGENPPTLKGFKNYLEGFDWFKKLSVVAKNNRAQRYFHEVEEMCGEVKETKKKSATPSKSKRKCSIETIRKFYLVVKRASESRVGISKRDVEAIMGYKFKMSTKAVDNLNEYIWKETGFKPLSLESSAFVDYEIITVDYDIAQLILEDLKEKLGGTEPIMPNFDDFERMVKSIIKNDYNALSMFEKNNTIDTTEKIRQFKELAVGKAYGGNAVVCEKFRENLEKRYEIKNIQFACGGKYITVLDTEENSEIRKALGYIADIFAGYFCENIVDSEKKIFEEGDLTDLENSRLLIIESLFFKGRDGEMFLSDLWKRFDETDIPRGWPLLDLLKKHPEKFRIEHSTNPAGYSEDKIIYTAPKKEEPVIEPEELPEAQEDVKPEPEIINKDVEGKGKERKILEATVGFKDYSDKPSMYLNPSEVEVFDNTYYMYDIEVMMNVDSILEFLKLCHTHRNTLLCKGKKISEVETELKSLLRIRE